MPKYMPTSKNTAGHQRRCQTALWLSCSCERLRYSSIFPAAVPGSSTLPEEMGA
jgi:hypothetical protein